MCGEEIEVIGKANENKDKEHFLKVVRNLSPMSSVLNIANRKKGLHAQSPISKVLVRLNFESMAIRGHCPSYRPIWLGESPPD